MLRPDENNSHLSEDMMSTSSVHKNNKIDEVTNKNHIDQPLDLMPRTIEKIMSKRMSIDQELVKSLLSW